MLQGRTRRIAEQLGGFDGMGGFTCDVCGTWIAFEEAVDAMASVLQPKTRDRIIDHAVAHVLGGDLVTREV